MSVDDATQNVTSATSEVWSNHVSVPGTPEGFTARTTYPTNPDGVEVMLERWQAGTEEPPHFHLRQHLPNERVASLVYVFHTRCRPLTDPGCISSCHPCRPRRRYRRWTD